MWTWGRTVVFGLVMMLGSQVQARPADCPSLLTDGECEHLVSLMSMRDKYPEEYGRQIVSFARLMAERHQTCQCDDWMIRWADKVNDSFTPKPEASPR